MQKPFWTFALWLGSQSFVMPVLADSGDPVKAGVDAWARGDYKEAVADWRPAAIEGDADAQFDLGQAYKLGRGVPVDMAMAESWYRKAAIQGQVAAEDDYGLALFQDGKREDALTWLEKSVARGEARAQFALATMLYNGDGVARDWPRAYALAHRSAASGLQRASEVEAQMDQYIPYGDRQKGLALAREYEAALQGADATSSIADIDKRRSEAARAEPIPAPRTSTEPQESTINASVTHCPDAAAFSAPTMPANTAPGSPADFKGSVPSDTVLFAKDEAHLDATARAILAAQAAWLIKWPRVPVSLEGHAADPGSRNPHAALGTREYNLALGDRRATQVKDYLVACGVAPARISPISYGKERMLGTGLDEVGLAQERRAVTVVLTGEFP